MSKLSFVYCFSKNLAVTEEQYTVSLELLESSTKLLGEFFKFKIVTDSDTVADLNHLTKDIEIVDTKKFVFLDDFKISLLETLLPDEILVDPDILMKRKPIIENNKDIIFDYEDSPQQKWYIQEIEELKGTLLYDRIKQAKNIPFIPNIGFLRINNTALLSEYIKMYKVYSKDILDKIQVSFPKFSILLGQYLLGILLYEGNYSYFNLRRVNSGKVYIHLGGEQKYRKFKVNKSVI
tara:strand:+ start:74 stop:781 length:708 start_codon:yes stop_codon:yes gene_type:complete